MEFAQVLYVLWRRRVWLLVGLLVALLVGFSTGYRFSVLPPGVEPRALAIGAADTQLLVDTNKSALTNLKSGFDPLSQRATVYTRLMTTEPVRRAIARELQVSPRAIVTEAPIQGALTPATEPTAAQRSDKLLGENRDYRLRFTSEPGQPTITIAAQATNVRDAERLADGAAVGFIKYLDKIQDRQRITAKYRVKVRQLGAASGGEIGGSTSMSLLVLVTAGVFVAWAVVMVFWVSVAEQMRRLRAAEAGEAAEPASS